MIATVLTFAGLDPSGGAGLQADIETIAALGGTALPIMTANTIQNTQSFLETQPVDPDWLKRQTQHLLQDITPDAIKIGLLSSTETVNAIYESLITDQLKDLPIVLDPVLRSGSGEDLSNDDLILAIKEKLLPLTTIITPNDHEARKLTGCDSLNAAATKLIEMGCRFVLITGADEAEEQVENHLYGQNGLIEVYNFEKLPDTYHGSGCTLSSAITVLLAKGLNHRAAVEQAQIYTLETLKAGHRIGKRQKHPGRIIQRNCSLDET